MPLRIAIFASGSGSNAENIVHYFSGSSEFQFPLIISNQPNAYIHKRAETLKIPSFTFTKEQFFDAKPVLELLTEYNIDAIVLAGFLLKIPTLLIQHFPDKIINIHPALLPKFGGKGMYGIKVHQAVKEAGEPETGITIHYVNENYDDGNILFQARCPISADDTAEMIAAKVHLLEHEYYPQIIEKIW
jgi:phosphoribosylglycinamide formyltransferase-1